MARERSARTVASRWSPAAAPASVPRSRASSSRPARRVVIAGRDGERLAAVAARDRRGGDRRRRQRRAVGGRAVRARSTPAPAAPTSSSTTRASPGRSRAPPTWTSRAWDETMAINVRGTLLCIKYAVPRMRARGGGSIINMSSLMGLRGTPMRSAYTASKYAVLGITDAVSQEVGVDNIRVNALCPGAVNGELMQRVIAARVERRGPRCRRRSSARTTPTRRRCGAGSSRRKWPRPRCSSPSPGVGGDHRRAPARRRRARF